ncbi:MAG: hypothetical protein Q9221_003948 [Calogaya cf. arnoldii]
MATNHSISSRHSPHNSRIFHFSDDSPSPLHNPDTSYLTSTPQLITYTPTLHKESWEQLKCTPTRTSVPASLWVPAAATPPTPRLRNDTPTPAASTPSSWVERRRPGQLVDRPLDVPNFRTNALSTTKSLSPDAALDKRSVSKATTAAGSDESVGSRTLSRQLGRDGQQVDEITPVQAPASAKIVSRPIQLDGVPEETRATQLDGVPEETGGMSHDAQPRSHYRRLLGSLRRIPSMLNLKQHKSPLDDKVAGDSTTDPQATQPSRPARVRAATQSKVRRWSLTSGRSKKNATAGRSSHESTRSLFDVWGIPNSRESRDGTRVDDNRYSHSSSGSPIVNPFADGIAEHNNTHAEAGAKEEWQGAMARKEAMAKQAVLYPYGGGAERTLHEVL